MARDDPDHPDRIQHGGQRVEDGGETAAGEGLEVPFQGRQELRVVLGFDR